MSYDAVEAGLLSVIQLLPDYNSTNSSRGDFRILAKGVSRAVVLSPGAFIGRDVVATPRQMQTIWVINLHLLIPFTSEISTIRGLIRTERQKIIDQIDKYPTLGAVSGVVSAILTGGEEPRIWQGESQRWWLQVMQVEVEERSSVTIAE